MLALCGASGLWATGSDEEANAAPTLKRKRSDDDVGPAPKEAVQQPENKKRRLSQKKSTGTPRYLGKPVMSSVLALPEEQIYADGQLDTGFKKLLQDKAILMRFLELFVPECKVGVEDIETLGGLSEYTPSGDRTSLENFYIQITDGRRFPLKKPVTDDSSTLFPQGKEWDPTFFESFTDRQWFLSILRHAQDLTAERLKPLKPYIKQKPFVRSMLKVLRYKKWTLQDKLEYKSETFELQRVYGATFLIARERAREEARLEKERKETLEVWAQLILRGAVTFEIAKESLSAEAVAALKEYLSGRLTKSIRPRSAVSDSTTTS